MLSWAQRLVLMLCSTPAHSQKSKVSFRPSYWFILPTRIRWSSLLQVGLSRKGVCWHVLLDCPGGVRLSGQRTLMPAGPKWSIWLSPAPSCKLILFSDNISPWGQKLLQLSFVQQGGKRAEDGQCPPWEQGREGRPAQSTKAESRWGRGPIERARFWTSYLIQEREIGLRVSSPPQNHYPSTLTFDRTHLHDLKEGKLTEQKGWKASKVWYSWQDQIQADESV